MQDLLRIVLIGSVDTGKSTFLGRLLYETNSVYLDQYEAVKKTSERKGLQNVDLSLITDGLKAEREQSITIDVAYRYFSTSKRKFIIADCPGHIQYTKNMVVGASNSEISLILIDAKEGITEQSKRHAFISSLMQLSHTLVLVNKLDLVNYSQKVFNEIIENYKFFLEKLDIKDIFFLPISALCGDNIVKKSKDINWYSGPTVLEYLENTYVKQNHNTIDFRFPIQSVLRLENNSRGYTGKILSGNIKKNEEIIVLPSMRKNRVKKIVKDKNEFDYIDVRLVTVILEDELDISRGNMIVKMNNIPFVDNSFEATICWLDKEPIDLNKKYFLRHTTNITKAVISELRYVIDVNTLHRIDTETIKENEIGRVKIETTDKLFFDYYKINNKTGSFILIDPDTYQTSAAGFIKSESKEKNIIWKKDNILKEDREKHNGHRGKIIWMTGFSGSGKTTLGRELEKRLFITKYCVILLDGDIIRKGLCNDLNFSEKDISENIRRIGEIAKILVDNGMIVICTFISPLRKQRNFVRTLVEKDEFLEVYVKCPILECEKRDVKGIYKKFRKGEILNLSGFDFPYEKPVNPEIIVDTNLMDIDNCVKKIIKVL